MPFSNESQFAFEHSTYLVSSLDLHGACGVEITAQTKALPLLPSRLFYICLVSVDLIPCDCHIIGLTKLCRKRNCIHRDQVFIRIIDFIVWLKIFCYNYELQCHIHDIGWIIKEFLVADTGDGSLCCPRDPILPDFLS